MGAPTRTLLAWSLWLATFGCLLGGLVVTLFLTRPLTADVLVTGAFNGALWLLFATVGLVLTLRRPENPIGWLYAAGGLVWSVYVPFDPWVDALQVADRPLSLAARLASLVGDSFWAIGIALAITLPLLLLPDGRLRSRRWRVVVVATVVGTVLDVVGWWLSPEPMTQTLEPVAKPFALAGWGGSAAVVVTWTGFALTFATIPAAALSVVLRFRASRGVERQQLRWVAAGATVAVVGPALLVPLDTLGLAPADSFSWPLLLSVPLAIAVAVLRYRLWDLDRLVSRTVAYVLVTALLLVPYLVVVPAAGGLFKGSGSLAVAAATLTAAAAFQPLRRRVQELVDRRFNRRRYDAARTVEAFAARLRDQVDLDALHGELLAVVAQTMQPTTASLWLRSTPR
ncbi:MAG TPA: hypothetical protein VFQ49_11365 [Actinomycetes bacterium]|nr:hypothetical protein [Actinomycetes bacterium]